MLRFLCNFLLAEAVLSAFYRSETSLTLNFSTFSGHFGQGDPPFHCFLLPIQSLSSSSGFLTIQHFTLSIPHPQEINSFDINVTIGEEFYPSHFFSNSEFALHDPIIPLSFNSHSQSWETTNLLHLKYPSTISLEVCIQSPRNLTGNCTLHFQQSGVLKGRLASPLNHQSKIRPSQLGHISKDNYEVMHVDTTSETGLRTVILVNDFADSYPNMTACESWSTLASCNLRSALYYCNYSLAMKVVESCEIQILQGRDIILEESYGVITLDAYSGHLKVLGNGCTILADTPQSFQFLDIRHPNSFENLLVFSLTNTTIIGFGDDLIDGGAMYFHGLSAVNISFVNYIFNRGNLGGALHFTSVDHVVITDCHFRNNTAQYGGAVTVNNVASIMFYNNEIIYNEAAWQGGGLYFNSGNSNMTLDQNKFEQNFGRFGGGAIAFFDNNRHILFSKNLFVMCSASIFSTSPSVGSGGAIYFGYRVDDVVIDRCLFSSNIAGASGSISFLNDASNVIIMDSNFTDGYSDYDSSFVTLSGRNLTILRCAFIESYSSSTALNFAVHLLLVNEVTITSCWFQDNSPISLRSYLDNLNVSILNSVFYTSPSWSYSHSGILLQSTFVGEIIGCVFQGTIADPNSEFSGAVTVDVTSTLVMRDCVFVNNTGKYGGAVGILAIGQPFQFENCQFKNNTATHSGGGIYIDDYGVVNLFNCSFHHNHAIQYGGGISINSYGQLMIHDSEFSGNTCLYQGGAALAAKSDNHLLISRCIFTGNRGSQFGGALQLGDENQLIFISNSTFFSNSVLVNGAGAIVIGSYNNEILIQECLFHSNQGFNGGGISIGRSNVIVKIKRCRFSLHNASNGASIYLDSSNLRFQLENSSFHENTAVNGGGMYIASSNQDILIRYCLFHQNNATMSGGALYFLSWNQRVNVLDSTLSWNFATHGGGLYAYSNNRLSAKNLFLQSNFALRDGGGAYFAYQNKESSLSFCTFLFNSAVNGGGVYFQSGNNKVGVFSSQFIFNNASHSGGAIFVQDSNWDVLVQWSQFYGNFAVNYGGAMTLQSANAQILIDNSGFRKNMAYSAGGTLYFALFNSNLTVQNSHILESASEYGGSIYVGNDHEVVHFSRVNISGSSARIGGAIYISPFNENLDLFLCDFQDCQGESIGSTLTTFASSNRLSDCSFSDDATIRGSILFLSRCKTQIDGSYFYGNYGVSGGAYSPIYQDEGEALHIFETSFDFNSNFASGGVMTNEVSSVKLYRCRFMKNVGQVGAAMISSSETLIIADAHFVDNTGQICGALLLDGISWAHINSSKFEYNFCSSSAGAISANIIQGNITGTIFQSNSVDSGDGSAIALVASNVSIRRNHFRSNHAINGGGAIYWLSSSNMKSPHGLLNNNFYNNTAAYGADWATEGSQLVTTSRNINVTVYNSPIPSILIRLLDNYNQLVVTENSFTVDVLLPSLNPCAGNTPYVTGVISDILQFGQVNFSSFQVYCAPGYSVDLQFQTKVYDVIVFTIVTLWFRPCSRGEYYNAQECYPCEKGTYSIKQFTDLSEMNQVAVCKPCPSHTTSCYKDQIKVKAGYWRISNLTDIIQECPFGIQACSGGYEAGDTSCKVGYEGPLCAVCSQGYGYQSSSKQCIQCDQSTGGSHGTKNIVQLVLYLLFCFLVLSTILYFMQPRIRLQIQTVEDFYLLILRKLGIVPASMGDGDQQARLQYVVILARRIRTRIKVYLIMYQILISLPFVLDLSFPSPVHYIFDSLNFLNLTISDVLFISCTNANEWDFIDYVVFDTLLPLGVISAIYLMQCAHVFRIRSRIQAHPSEDLEKQIVNVKGVYFFLILIFIYLILPSVSTKLFQTFRCRDIDPDDTVPGTDLYMAADYQISCASSRYTFGVIWASCMIILYPIGCPLYFFYLLYQIRNYLQLKEQGGGGYADQKDIHTTLTTSLPATPTFYHQQLLISCRFLYESYHPQYWWWEIIDIVQRLLLTGVLVLISQGSAVQIIIGALLTLFFLQLYVKYQPSNDSLILNIKTVSYWQIFFVFWIALLIRADFPSLQSRLLAIFFILIIFMNFLIDIWRFIRTVARIPASHETPPVPDLHNDMEFRSTEMGRISSRDENCLPSSRPLASPAGSSPVVSPLTSLNSEQLMRIPEDE